MLSWWKLAAAGAAVAVVLGALWMWRDDVRRAAYDAMFADLVEESNRSNLETIEKLKRQIEDDRETVRKMAETSRTLASSASKIREEASSLEDGPLAPSAKRSLEMLKDLENAKAR